MQNKKLLWIFAGIVALRAIFALAIGYVDDDAYHWTWTRQLELSYFDHPGMVAWIEWLSTTLFGDNRFGVRLPFFLCFIGVVILVWHFVKDLFGERAANFTSGVILFTPLWGFGGFVSSPEPPFIVLWTLALWVFWQGVRPDEKKWSVKKTWLWLGLIMGVGFNTKFPMVLLAPGFGLYLLATKEHRKDLLKPWPWVGILIATVLLAPIILWNLKYDWPSFKFQFHDRHSNHGYDPQRWLQFFGMQWGLMSPGVFVSLWLALLASIVNFKNPRWRFLFCMAIPSFLIFYPQPLWADFKPHWMGPAYFILAFGMGGLWVEGLVVKGRIWIRPFSQKYLSSLLVFLVPMTLLIYGPAIYPWVPKVARAINPSIEWHPKNDVSNELFGWPEGGEFILKRQKEIADETGRVPFLAGHRYETTAQIWRATLQRTYMLSSTKSHFTVTTSEEDYRALEGRDALLVTTDKYPFKMERFAKFDSCEPTEFKFYRADELARVFIAYHCKNFQGIRK